jgi:hypothetical protein
MYRITKIYQDSEWPGMFTVQQTTFSVSGPYDDPFPQRFIWGLCAARFVARTRFAKADELRENIALPVPAGEEISRTTTTGWIIADDSPLGLMRAAWNAENEARWADERRAREAAQAERRQKIVDGIAACEDLPELRRLTSMKVCKEQHLGRMKAINALLRLPPGHGTNLVILRELLNMTA